MDNVTAVQCVQCQGTARSSLLLALTEDIFTQASQRGLVLSEKYVPGRGNAWEDALSRFQGTSVEWHPCPQVFSALSLRYSLLSVNLFAFPTTSQIPLFLSFSHMTEARGPNAFKED